MAYGYYLRKNNVNHQKYIGTILNCCVIISSGFSFYICWKEKRDYTISNILLRLMILIVIPLIIYHYMKINDIDTSTKCDEDLTINCNDKIEKNVMSIYNFDLYVSLIIFTLSCILSAIVFTYVNQKTTD